MATEKRCRIGDHDLSGPWVRKQVGFHGFGEDRIHIFAQTTSCRNCGRGFYRREEKVPAPNQPAIIDPASPTTREAGEDG